MKKRGSANRLVEHLINCNSDPFLPSGWKVEEHKTHGQIQWDPEDVDLYLAKEQGYELDDVGNAISAYISGKRLRRRLEDEPTLNANVLDFLLKKENQRLIPQEWKGERVLFWGTIYRAPNGNSCVRYLYWNKGSRRKGSLWDKVRWALNWDEDNKWHRGSWNWDHFELTGSLSYGASAAVLAN